MQTSRPSLHRLIPAVVLLLGVPAAQAQRSIATFSGTVAAGLGDLDGDGFGDVAVADLELGAVSIVSGATGGTLASPTPSGSPIEFGAGLANAGDLTGDGLSDLLVWDSGALKVHAFDGVTGLELFTVVGPTSPLCDFFFGYTLCAAGDINGDGLGDFVIGAAPRNGSVCEGSVYMCSGADGSYLWTVTSNVIHTHGGENHFGWKVSRIGDINADGIDDIAVGRPANTGSGALCGFDILSGSTGQILRRWSPADVSSCSGTGVFLGPLGDIDGDGVPDHWVVEFPDFPISLISASVIAFSGSTGAEIYRIEGGPGSNFGFDTESVGDVDGDGLPDIGITKGLSLSQNFVQVHSGADGSHLFNLVGAGATPSAQYAVALGDIDGDGFGDVGALRSSEAWGTPQGAFIEAFERVPMNGRAICLGLPNSTGVGALMRAISPSGYMASANDLTLAVTRLPASTFGLVSVSQGTAVVFHPGGSDGRLCIAAPASGRFGILSANAMGEALFSPNLDQIPMFSAAGASLVSAAAGDTFNFQLWYRDIGANGPTSNFSSAVGVTFN